MKKLFLVLFAFVGILAASAQQNKPVLTVENFTTNGADRAAAMLRNKVIAAIQEAGRVNVVDVTNADQLRAEEERRKSESAMSDAGRVGDMGTLMSNAILKGSLDDITTTRSESVSNGKKVVSYTSTVKFSLSIIDTTNGTIIKQETFDNLGVGDTEEKAVVSALDVKKSPIKRFINNTFAVGGKVIAVDEEQKGKAKTIFIDLGSADGLKKGQKLEVFKEVDIAGEKSKKLIGEIQVKEVMSAGRSLCDVKKGGDVIVSELEKGTKLPVETKEEKGNLFKSFIEN